MKPTLEQRKAASEKAGTIFEQQDVNYTLLSATDGQACANCVFYRASGFDGIDWPHCHIVQDWPDPIEPTGWCNRWEAKPEPPPPPPTVAEAIEDLAEVLGDVVNAELSEDGKREMYITPSDDLMARIRKGLSPKLTPGTNVMKDAAGQRYMFMVTSNGYRDRDQEHVATKALETYVANCWTGDDTGFIGDNDHYIWHMKELGSISDLMFADVWSGFLVELWREQPDNPIAKAFYNFVEENPDIEWGASHGFQGVLKGDTFTHIHKFESSSLPLDAAANLLTLSEVLPMNAKSKRDSFLDKLFESQFGLKGAAAMLHEGPDKLRAALEQSGIQAKSLGEGSDALKQARADAIADSAETLIGIIEVQDEFEKLLTAKDTVIDGLTSKVTGMENQLKSYDTEVKDLREIVNAGPRRAVKDGTTVVTDPAAIEAAKNQQTEWDPNFPGMNVPLEKKQPQS